jgi:hypothetical protein
MNSRIKNTAVWFSARLLAILLLLVLPGVFVVSWAGAAPLPPRMAANHQIRQCAMVLPGDECGDAILPPGWEYLDKPECPSGYTQVELRLEWKHFKAPHCCTESHSGVPGDCQDVIKQPVLRQCAFVDNLSTCPQLPPGWQPLGRDCPVSFTWIDPVTCPGQAHPAANTPTAGSNSEHSLATLPAASPPPPATAQVAATTPAQDPTGMCTAPALLGLGLAIWWVRRKN